MILENSFEIFNNIIPFAQLIFFKSSIAYLAIQHAFGVKTKIMIDSIPEKVRPRAVLISRIFVIIWLLIIAWSLIIQSWLPALFILLPHFYGKLFTKLFRLHNTLA